ncbi:MAG: cyclic nucleotide-binding domain-containing protein [Pseudomonadota bacterium]
MSIDPVLKDIQDHSVELTPEDEEQLRRYASAGNWAAGDRILTQAKIADRIFFVLEGVAGSEQTWDNGKSTIARFFQPVDLCTNVTSAWTGQIGSDELVAISDVTTLSIPMNFFVQEYLYGSSFGLYLRKRVLNNQLFSKELICAKTSGQTEERYHFLEKYQPAVLDLVPQKDVARFLGLTAQGFSRFLRNQRG